MDSHIMFSDNGGKSYMQLISSLLKEVDKPMLVIDVKGIVVGSSSSVAKLFNISHRSLANINLCKLGINISWLEKNILSLLAAEFPKKLSLPLTLGLTTENCIITCNRIEIGNHSLYTIIFDTEFEQTPHKSISNADDDLISIFIQSISIPILFVDFNDLKIIHANNQSLSFFGLPSNELLGMALASFTDIPHDQFNSSLKSFVNNGYTGLEQTFITAHASRDTELHYSVIERNGRKVLLCILLDITQQNLAFADLQRIKNTLTDEIASQTKDLVRISNALLEQIKSRRLIEQELRQSQELFIHLFMLNPDGLVLRSLNPDRILEVNQSFLKIFGLTAKEVQNKTLQDLTLFCDTPKYNKMLSQLYDNKRLAEIPLSMMSKTGNVVFVQWSGETIKLNNQEFILEVFHDITQIQNYHQKLVDSEEKYRTMFNNALVGIFRVQTTTGIVCNCNRYFAQLIGYENEKHIVGKSIDKHFIDFKSRIDFLNELRVKGSAVRKLELITLKGGKIWVIDYAVFNIDEQYIDEVVVDITDREVMETQLVSKENRFRSMIEKASDLILIVDSDGQILYLSPSVETELGYSISSSYNENISNYLNPNDKERVLEIIRSEGAAAHTAFEARVKHKDGYEKGYEFSVTDLRNDPAVGGIILNAHDITERVRAREEINTALLKEMELNRQKTQFISTVSHEFRTPLTNISLNVQLLHKFLGDSDLEKVQSAINRLMNAEKRLTTLLNEVSLVSKDQSGRLSFNPKLWNLQTLAHELIEQMEYQMLTNIEISIFGCKERQALMDRTLLTHILGNLVSNAIKYSPKNKPIKLALGVNSMGEFKICIKDQGIGIPREEQEFLFDPYFRASNSKGFSGTGLGLNIVSRCVELHGGKIGVESEVGSRTEITITVPIKL